MGYNANGVDVNFVIPAGRVAAALAALDGDERLVVPEGGFAALDAAVRELTCFQDNIEQEDGSFELGWHHDKWLSGTDDLLYALAPFAVEGSVVRMEGEDGCLFGFRVVGGKIVEEYGVIEWRV